MQLHHQNSVLGIQRLPASSPATGCFRSNEGAATRYGDAFSQQLELSKEFEAAIRPLSASTRRRVAPHCSAAILWHWSEAILADDDAPTD